jgi:hypothetical protein
MTARLTARLSHLALFVGAGFVLGSTVGCGSEVESTPPAEDTGIVIVDSTAVVDTTPAADTATGPEATPGSLFDAVLPDISLEGGKTVQGCYDCTVDKCETEMQACDKNNACKGVLLCVLIDCAGKFSDQSCLFGCALSNGISSTMDPAVALLSGVGSCNQSKCTDSCPLAPLDGGAPDTRPNDSAPDATTADGTSTDGAATDSATTDVGATDAGAADAPGDVRADSETGAMMSSPFKIQKETFQPKQSVEPGVIVVLEQLSSSFASPTLRQGVIDHLKR